MIRPAGAITMTTSRGLILVRQLADDGLQQVVGGDQPLDDAELVRHQDEAARAWRSSASSRITLMVWGTMTGSFCLASLGGDCPRSGQTADPGLHHPDDLVQLPVADREQVVRGPLQQGADLRRRRSRRPIISAWGS